MPRCNLHLAPVIKSNLVWSVSKWLLLAASRLIYTGVHKACEDIPISLWWCLVWLFACVLLVRGHWLMDRCGFCFGHKNCRICHASTKSRSCNDIFKVHWCHGYLKVSSWHNTSVLIMQRAWTHTPTEKFWEACSGRRENLQGRWVGCG